MELLLKQNVEYLGRTGDVVKVSRFSEAWYGSTYDGARRPY